MEQFFIDGLLRESLTNLITDYILNATMSDIDLIKM